MKTLYPMTLLLGSLTLSWAAAPATTINVSNNHSYGANLGWMDWRGV